MRLLPMRMVIASGKGFEVCSILLQTIGRQPFHEEQMSLTA